jgi:hypothetical protein
VKVCSICAQPRRRAEVDRRLAAGDGYSAIAQATAASRFAIRRHAQHYQERAGAAATVEATAAVSSDGDLASKLRAIELELDRIAAQAAQAADGRLSVAVARERSRVVELQAKIQGQILTGSRSLTVNVEQQLSPQDAVAVAIEFLELAGYRVTRPQVPVLEGEMQIVH